MILFWIVEIRVPTVFHIEPKLFYSILLLYTYNLLNWTSQIQRGKIIATDWFTRSRCQKVSADDYRWTRVYLVTELSIIRMKIRLQTNPLTGSWLTGLWGRMNTQNTRVIYWRLKSTYSKSTLSYQNYSVTCMKYFSKIGFTYKQVVRFRHFGLKHSSIFYLIFISHSIEHYTSYSDKCLEN